MRRMLAIALLVEIVFIWAAPVGGNQGSLGSQSIHSAPARAAGVYFDDSDPAIMRLGNGSYEFAFRKSNGSIQSIIDKSTGNNLTPGSRYECLWGAVLLFAALEQFTGGCSVGMSIHYNYDPAGAVLTFTYTAGAQAVYKVNAVVQIKAHEDSSLDMLLDLDNHSPYVIDRALFPCDLVFHKSEIQEALLPVLPGLVLEPAFFAQNSSYKVKYPGYPGAFASFTALKTTQGQFAIYDLYSGLPSQETWLGFQNDNDLIPYLPNSTTLVHEFAARAPGNHAWKSTYVRIRVGLSFVQAIQQFRADNGLDSFTSLRQKLGATYDQVVQSPLYKIDTVNAGLRFADYDAQVLSRVPLPGILHPVAFQPGGHDHNFPDFLPPDPQWGSTADFAAMFRTAQARGFLVMPYTNPTWWDLDGPAVANLPEGTMPEDIAALDINTNLVIEKYSNNNGVVVSPRAPFVLGRLDQLAQDMTGALPSNMLFEDQVGARPWLYDNNPSANSPLDYIAGWLDHTRLYQGKLLNTELGFDRLAETEVGFHGSLLLPEKLGYTTGWWGTGTWHAYPLATMLARDKTLFYQHDLATETFTNTKEFLAWNMAYGYQLSYDLIKDSFGGGLESEWLRLVGVFQKYALALYAGERVTNFDSLAPDVTRTTFETCTVTYNSSASAAYTTSGYTLPSQGAMVACPDGRLAAGIFRGFDGQPLSEGDHYLVVQREVGRATIWQPIGKDTPLTINNLPVWGAGDHLKVTAYTLQGQAIASVPVTVSGQMAQFTYVNTINNQLVGYIRVTWPESQIFLPVTLK